MVSLAPVEHRYHDNGCCIDCVDMVAESARAAMLSKEKSHQFELNETGLKDWGRQQRLDEAATVVDLY